MENTLLKMMLASPQLPELIEKANVVLTKENQKKEEFYALVHENIKAEFIYGEIILHSPVKGKHWKVCTNLATYMNIYVLENQLGVVGVEKVLINFPRNNYEPDIVFFGLDKSQYFTAEQMLFPAPDLVVEVLSESTRENDYGVKFEDYQVHQVAEYWIIDPDNQTVEQYILANDKYLLYQKLAKTGILRTDIIPGFSIAIEKIF